MSLLETDFLLPKEARLGETRVVDEGMVLMGMVIVVIMLDYTGSNGSNGYGVMDINGSNKWMKEWL